MNEVRHLELFHDYTNNTFSSLGDSLQYYYDNCYCYISTSYHKRAIVGSFDKSSHFMNCFPVPLRKSISESQKKKSSSLLKLLTDTIPKMTE